MAHFYRMDNDGNEEEQVANLGYWREVLADTQHSIWSHWMVYLFSRCTKNDDGSMTIPPDLVERWNRQLDTPYQDLSEAEKGSDRDQADKVIRSITYD